MMETAKGFDEDFNPEALLKLLRGKGHHIYADVIEGLHDEVTALRFKLKRAQSRNKRRRK